MSSCDGARPIVIRAGSSRRGHLHPHAKAANPPQTQGQHENWRHVSMFWSLVPCIRSHKSVGLLVLCVVTDQMVGDRWSLRSTILRGEVACLLRQPSGPADWFRSS